MTEINVSNKRLDLEKSNNYILSIRVYPDGFLFSILNHFSNTYLFFREVQVPVHLQAEKLESLLSSEDFLQCAYYRVILESCNPASTLMPVSLFDANKAEVYFVFDNNLNSTHQVCYNNLSLIQVVNIFSVERKIVELLDKRFGKVEKVHQQTALLAKSLSYPKNTDDHSYKLSLQIHKGWFDLMLVKDGALQLLNAFEYVGQNDILYFVLNALKQFKVQPVDVSLCLSGADCNDLEILLSDYIGKVVKDERTERAEFPPEFFTISAYQFSNFFYIPFCEL